ncbi:hypothetical protein CCACVL1_11943, partial [Corchorus capsularis]
SIPQRLAPPSILFVLKTSAELIKPGSHGTSQPSSVWHRLADQVSS